MSSNRRGVGLSAFSRSSIAASQYASHGSNLRATQSTSFQTQLSVFQNLLHQFSITHAKEIRSNPSFRAEFARMCNAIGVDPLASSHHKGKKEGGSLWAQMLGESVNDFYFELAVRVVEVCRETRGTNGGLVSLAEVRKSVLRGKAIGGGMEVSDDDVVRAVESLKPLGSGFTIIKLGHSQMIRSIPKELNTDQSTVLEAIQVLGYVTVSMLQVNLEWERARAKTVIDDLMGDSLVWADKQAEETEYWSPAYTQGT
ncbi:EAP30 family protein Dot2 [Pseudovirgaria hyperparasitica]|uniref:Vacuolar-sorting protein SNF8 n=1 Tax=Pseudovirgaria hyperparasitica TaxID=470096 RepID=A0A6A6WEC9_9PEZI|nr:EAP30 family protein Dot2 [Pseudovirgaria hyperparasitica]KAF2761178.1 EAP30 family protein Dot2 [Pseudovirgaria hyperparasitica]